jgi:hypothetical protein
MCQNQDLNKLLQERELMGALIKQHLLRAQTKMKQQADKKRADISFDVGDQVFVKLQLYVQSSLALVLIKSLPSSILVHITYWRKLDLWLTN